MLAYLLRGGNLPWMKVAGKNMKEKMNKITDLKYNLIPDELFSGFPPEFAIFLEYCRETRFE